MDAQDRRPAAEATPRNGCDAIDTTRLLAAVFDRLPVGVTVETQDGRKLLVNQAAARQFGHAREPALAATDIAPPCPPAGVPAEDAVQRVGDRALQMYRSRVYLSDETLEVSTSIDVTERLQVENELLQRLCFDDLTGLPNRSLLRHRVEAILERGGRARFALGFIDIDNFKHINDFYSHAIGDAVLVKFAERIARRLRPSDILARISGDEFVLILDPLGTDDELHAFVDDLLGELQCPFLIDGFEVFTSASIGVSVYPEHGADYEVLRRNADSAMYRAKGNSKGGVVFFDLKMGQAVTARMEMEQRLRLAIRDGRFVCAFQPKVDIRTHEVVGLEALIRWRDEAGEIQGPGDFISLAAELGLIDQITHLMLGETVAAMEVIDDVFGPATTISINVAAIQAGNRDFMRGLIDDLKATGCAPRFMLELTEDAFIAKNQFQSEILPMLREIGVRVSIDDFGTGYSSLSALADITADEIKIDRSFITDIHKRPRSQSVLKAIESLSLALGMSMVAEGVETFEELAYLQAASRIRYAQGFYFARPLFLGDIARQGLDESERASPALREAAEHRVASGAGMRSGQFSRRG